MLAVVTDPMDAKLSLNASFLTLVVGCDGGGLWQMSAMSLDEMTVAAKVALVRLAAELEAWEVAGEQLGYLGEE